MKIIIHHPYGANLTLDIDGGATVAGLKQQIQSALGRPIDGHYLVRETSKTLIEMSPLSDCDLEDMRTLNDYSIPTGTALWLYPLSAPKHVHCERY